MEMEDEWIERVEGRWREKKGGEKGGKIVVNIQNKIKKKEGIRKYTLTLGLITLQILKFQNVFKDCFVFLYTCLCVGGETRPEKSIRYPAAEVTGSPEPPDAGTGN